MDMRERSGGGDCLSVEKTLLRQKARDERVSKRNYAASKAKEDRDNSVFNFINNRLGGDLNKLRKDGNAVRKKSSSRDSNTGPGPSNSKKGGHEMRTNSKQDNIEAVQVFENLKRTRKEIERLSTSYERHRTKDPRSAAGIKAKLEEKRRTLKTLEAREAQLGKSKSQRESDKKMAVF